MASLAQKHKELPRLACAYDNLLLFRGQRDRWVPHDEFLTVEGARSYSTYQSINFSLLSTLYELLSKQLISVLVPPGCGEQVLDTPQDLQSVVKIITDGVSL